MADKYLKLNTTTGNAAEQEALNSSAGAGSAGKIPALDSAGRLAANMMPIGIVAETVSFVASENLTAGNFVNLYLDTVLKGAKPITATHVVPIVSSPMPSQQQRRAQVSPRALTTI